MFELLISGVGDAFSTAHWGTHFLVRKDDFLLGVDCPDSYRRALKESGFEHRGEPLAAEHLDAMILTHLHGDHVNGLEMTACHLRFSHQRRLKLLTPPESAASLWERLKPSLHVLWDGEVFHPQRLEDFLDVEVLAWGEAGRRSIGPWTLITRPTRHHLPASAMRLSDGEHTLAYSCDTAFDEGLIAWMEDADLIVHESSLGAAHTPLHKLMELPEAIQRKMLVVHYPDELIGADLGDKGLRFARQGERYLVGDGIK